MKKKIESGLLRSSILIALLGVWIFGAESVATTGSSPADGDSVVIDFEHRGLDGWEVGGNAFQIATTSTKIEGKRIQGTKGAFFISSGITGRAAKGTAVSPEFTIEKDYLNFLIGGDRYWPDELGLALVVDGKVIRRAAARAPSYKYRSDLLYPTTWDVREFKGRTARIHAVDSVPHGALYVDAIIQADAPASLCINAAVRFDESLRPQFHYSPPDGRLNDPNGLFHYGDLWHLMYQRVDLFHRATIWGYAVSRDLIHWEERTPPIEQDNPAESFYSGGAMVDTANASGLKGGEHPPIFICYTLVPYNPTKSNAPEFRKQPCFAVSTDGGETWKKWRDNPLWFPEHTTDRDGVPFYYEPTNEWFIVWHLSHENQREKSTFGIFRSPDLRNWELIQRIKTNPPLWECPDMFQLPLDGNPDDRRWILTEGRGDYIVGSFDGKQFTAETEKIKTNFGGQYYAAQTFKNAPDDRVVQVAWMNARDPQEQAYPGMPFVNQMSFPAELTLRSTPDGPRIHWWPVKEIESIRGKRLLRENIAIGPRPIKFAWISSPLLDLRIQAESGTAEQLVVNIRGQRLIYDFGKEELSGQRSPYPQDNGYKAAPIPQTAQVKVERGRAVPLPSVDGKIDLRILVDRASLDLYANQGAVHLSFNIWPTPDDKSLEISTRGGNGHLVRAEIFELNPSKKCAELGSGTFPVAGFLTLQRIPESR